MVTHCAAHNGCSEFVCMTCEYNRALAKAQELERAVETLGRIGYATVNLVNQLDAPRLPRAEFRRTLTNIKANLQVLQRVPILPQER